MPRTGYLAGMDWTTWLLWSVVVAVVLYVWRSLDARLDRQDERHQADLASLRTDLANMDRRLARIKGLLESGLAGPKPRPLRRA